jgi:chromate transporter
LLIVLVLTVLYGHYATNPVVTGALRGMGAVAAGLVTSTALKLMSTLKRNAMGVPICIGFGTLTVIMTAWLRVPLIWVIVGLGAVAIAVAWSRLKVSA